MQSDRTFKFECTVRDVKAGKSFFTPIFTLYSIPSMVDVPCYLGLQVQTDSKLSQGRNRHARPQLPVATVMSEVCHLPPQANLGRD